MTDHPSPTTTAAQHGWWDHSLTSAGRSDILKTAGLKLPAKILWRHMSDEARAAVDHMRPSEFRPEDQTAHEAYRQSLLPTPPKFTPLATLQSIQDRLVHDDVLAIIDQSIPRTLTDAYSWARSLPFWEEYKSRFADQAIAVARVISRRAMKEFDLAFDDDGRVVQTKNLKRAGHIGKPTTTFPLRIGDQTVRVEYTERCFPNSSTDSFSFIGEPIEPPPDGIFKHKPHPLSETGYWHSYASHDAVNAVGGPQKYAQLLADAKLQDKENEFQSIFDGKSPETETSRTKRTIYKAQPVLGEYTAAVVEKRQEPDQEVKPVKQGELFT